MTSTSILGIRDRKRLETRARIESAAVSLVLRDGLTATTVEAISELADISPRTFFNYFDSKDSAILGVHQRDLGDELIAEHLSQRGDDDLVTSVVRLLLAVLGAPVVPGTSLHHDRMEVLSRHPEVLSSQFAQLSARAGRITETIEQLVADTPGWLPTAASERTAQAELLMAVAGGAIRASVRQWAAQTNAQTDAHTDAHTDVDTSSAASDIEHRAVTLIKEVVGNLA